MFKSESQFQPYASKEDKRGWSHLDVCSIDFEQV